MQVVAQACALYDFTYFMCPLTQSFLNVILSLEFSGEWAQCWCHPHRMGSLLLNDMMCRRPQISDNAPVFGMEH